MSEGKKWLRREIGRRFYRHFIIGEGQMDLDWSNLVLGNGVKHQGFHLWHTVNKAASVRLT